MNAFLHFLCEMNGVVDGGLAIEGQVKKNYIQMLTGELLEAARVQ
jgi:hypothetical protein